ncbi:uncharacterized protein BX664DRAFT_322119 [Halteromyces radiatus]|uniref:uncharacterized protein n=1 Tax=Halteromyces radiatus TaxID=101107 RepID=UPI00221F3A6D|nr:uncharacterized protein BX664DRAFT_322119 [Halteromyces radiatus]KAI8099788.1 hypothetical protein BX664DRAFT_322119 [Halteromyces radiatus]
MVRHQAISKGGLRPLLKWTRFIIYLLLLFLLYHTFVSFNVSSSSSSQSPDTHTITNRTHLDNQSPSSFTPLYRDFPWYKEPHPRVTMIGNASTTHLTTTERINLQQSLVDQAKLQAKLAFQKVPFHQPGGIPGSSLKTSTTVNDLRAKIDCWTKGQWIPSTSDQLIHHVQDPLYATCDKRFYKTHSPLEFRPETQYQWQPLGDKSMCSQTVLPRATPSQWCQVLNGRHILLVGDLVQYQLHEIFLDSLRDGPTVCFGELNCKDHTICSEADTRLRYLRNDILADNRRHNNNDGAPSGSVITWPFVASNILKAYPILILNRSPVVEDDETFITSLIQTMTTIRRMTPDALIIYRSSAIGHPYCDDASAPLTKPLTDDEKKRLPFGWAELDRRNAIARTIVEEAGGVYVDLAALVESRPDGHVGGRDCLRYCIPGPLDAWMDILYQVFAALG